MIELPEAVNLARQLTAELRGRRVDYALRGNAPHKFAFYTREPEEYAAVLPGKTVGDAWAHGACLLVVLEPGWMLELGGGGERIRFHPDASGIPARHQLLLGFCDGAALSVTVQGWGSVRLLERGQLETMGPPAHRRVSPTTDAFTYGYFRELLAEVPEADPRSVKAFLIGQPGVWGMGNGCLHDILYRARIHPRRRVAQATEDERRALYDAVTATLREVTDLGGRDTETDLYGRPGRYTPVLDRRAKGTPCGQCGTAIEAMPFLGGKCYLCPTCQPLPGA